jgi:hypothetical protein
MLVGYFDTTIVGQNLRTGGPVVKKLAPNEFDVLFRYRPTEPVTKVYLAGTFNEWKADAHAMEGPDGDGQFSTRVKLPAGNHEYKFVVDGTKWRQDPGNYRQNGNYKNSLLVLAGEQAPATTVPAPQTPEPTRATVQATPIKFGSKGNQELAKDFASVSNGNNLASLPTGDQVFLGIPFHIGPQMIGLGNPMKPEWPTRVQGLKVGMTLSKLHILHANEFGEGPADSERYVPEGTKIGQYSVHYSDGTVVEIPIVYGEDVRDWWFSVLSKSPTRGKVAWKGTNDYSSGLNAQIRLYLMTWQNPKPEVQVSHIDFSSNETGAAPFCVAISAEK